MKNKKDPEKLFLKRSELFSKLEEMNDNLQDIIIEYIKTINEKLGTPAAIGVDDEFYEEELYFNINFDYEIDSANYGLWMNSFVPDSVFTTGYRFVHCIISEENISKLKELSEMTANSLKVSFKLN